MYICCICNEFTLETQAKNKMHFSLSASTEKKINKTYRTTKISPSLATISKNSPSYICEFVRLRFKLLFNSIFIQWRNQAYYIKNTTTEKKLQCVLFYFIVIWFHYFDENHKCFCFCLYCLLFFFPTDKVFLFGKSEYFN